MIGAVDHDERCARQLGETLGALGALARVLGAMDEEHRTAHRAADPFDAFEIHGNSAPDSASIASTEPSTAQRVASSIALVEWGSGVISVKKKRAKSG